MTSRNAQITSAFEDWEQAKTQVENAGMEMRAAETNLKNMILELGRAIDPGSMKEGDALAVWVVDHNGDDVLMDVRKTGTHTYQLEVHHPMKPKTRGMAAP